MALIDLLAAYGIVAFFVIAALERVFPLIPSHALFAFIGVMSAETGGVLIVAVTVTAAGSVVGGLVLYGIGRAVGRDRSLAFAERVAPWVGTRPATARRWLDRTARRGRLIVGTTQLVPTIRLLTPLFAGLLAVPPIGICVALSVGSFLWVMIFSGTAWIVSVHRPSLDPLQVTLGVTLGLVAVQLAMGALWSLAWVIRRRMCPAIIGPDQP
ncbi:MAG: DedA family protein [Alphaproteobacteria bacterium]